MIEITTQFPVRLETPGNNYVGELVRIRVSHTKTPYLWLEPDNYDSARDERIGWIPDQKLIDFSLYDGATGIIESTDSNLILRLQSVTAKIIVEGNNEPDNYMDFEVVWSKDKYVAKSNAWGQVHSFAKSVNTELLSFLVGKYGEYNHNSECLEFNLLESFEQFRKAPYHVDKFILQTVPTPFESRDDLTDAVTYAINLSNAPKLQEDGTYSSDKLKRSVQDIKSAREEIAKCQEYYDKVAGSRWTYQDGGIISPIDVRRNRIINPDMQVSTPIKLKEKTMFEKLVENNKSAVSQAAYLEGGRIANNTAAKILGKSLPVFVRGYADTPIGKLVAANLAQTLVGQYRPRDVKLKKITEAMVVQAYGEAMKDFKLDELIDELTRSVGNAFDSDDLPDLT